MADETNSRALRREKQRADNVVRAAKMSLAQTVAGPTNQQHAIPDGRLYVGCSGWYYWEWHNLFYAGIARQNWFEHYAGRFNTVEINASFYSWPTPARVRSWLRQASETNFVYSVKVPELITHINKLDAVDEFITDFDAVAEILGSRFGCFLYQLPPSFHYTKGRLAAVVRQMKPFRRNVVEFRHESWWNDDVYAAFREAGIIFCSCSAPRLPSALVRTTEDVYLRMHGPERWYKHRYTDVELKGWADKIVASGAMRVWIYFNNTYEANAPLDAQTLRGMLNAFYA